LKALLPIYFYTLFHATMSEGLEAVCWASGFGGIDGSSSD
jgi:hypothetical protein